MGYEYELGFMNTPSLKFHPRCYVIWDEEQAALSEGSEPPAPGAGT